MGKDNQNTGGSVKPLQTHNPGALGDSQPQTEWLDRCVDIVGVTGSVPVTPTILKASKFNDLVAFAIFGAWFVTKVGEAGGKQAGANQSNLASRVQPSQQRPQLGAVGFRSLRHLLY